MSVEINETDHETIVVNGKEIFKDGDGKWISRQELTASESLAFSNYVNSKPVGIITDNGNKDDYYQIRS